jgi:hypothetical protein
MFGAIALQSIVTCSTQPEIAASDAGQLYHSSLASAQYPGKTPHVHDTR